MYKEPDICGLFLETDRISIRELNENDMNDFLEFALNADTFYTGDWNSNMTEDEAKQLFNQYVASHKVLAVELLENFKIIGILCIDEPSGHWVKSYENQDGCEINCVMDKAYGDAECDVEAVNKLTEYLLKRGNYCWVSACTDINNTDANNLFICSNFKKVSKNVCKDERSLPNEVVHWKRIKDSTNRVEAPDNSNWCFEVTCNYPMYFICLSPILALLLVPAMGGSFSGFVISIITAAIYGFGISNIFLRSVTVKDNLIIYSGIFKSVTLTVQEIEKVEITRSQPRNGVVTRGAVIYYDNGHIWWVSEFMQKGVKKLILYLNVNTDNK